MNERNYQAVFLSMLAAIGLLLAVIAWAIVSKRTVRHEHTIKIEGVDIESNKRALAHGDVFDEHFYRLLDKSTDSEKPLVKESLRAIDAEFWKRLDRENGESAQLWRRKQVEGKTVEQFLNDTKSLREAAER